MADNSLSRSQQLLADIDAKYGKTSSSAPAAPVVTPPVHPAPQPAAKKPGGMLEGAMDLIGNRNKQIDKAAGYSLGGKVGKRSFQYGGSTDGAVLEDDGAMAAGLGLIDQGRQQQAMAQQDLANKFAEIDGYACGGKVKAHADGGKVSSSKDNEKSILLGAAEVAGNSIMKAAKGAGEMMRWATGGPPPVRHDNPPPYVDSENPTKQKQYASGGKVKPRAAAGAKVDASGKISGPGTATSDSIPAKVSPTGEDILVANGERIISVEQDQLLERIAQMLGFDTVDAMFEQMTGKPVGPSMKNGMMAASDGSNWLDIVTKAISPVAPAVAATEAAPVIASEIGSKFFSAQDEKIGPSTTKPVASQMIEPVTNFFADSAQAARGDKPYDQIRAERSAGTNQPAGPQNIPSLQTGKFGLDGSMSIDVNKPTMGSTFMTGSAPGVAPVQPVQRGRDANGVITAESANAFQDSGGLAGMKSGSFYGTADLAGQNDRMAKSLGYASADDFNKQFKERADTVRGGVGVVGDVGGGLTQTDLDNADKSRRWMVEDELRKNGRSGHAADASMINNLLAANTAVAGARLRGDQQMQQPQTVRQQSVDPLDARKKQIEVAGMEEMAGLRGKALAGDPKAVAMINALSGKNSDKDRYHNLPNRKVYNEMGQVIDEVPGGLFDTQTGQIVQSGATQKPKQFTAGQTYTDANGNKAIYQKDGTWKEVK